LVQIPALQKNISLNEWNFWHHFTDIGGGLLQTIYLMLNVIFNPSRIETMILVINISIEMTVTHLFKVWHHQSRPFWDSSLVRSDACTTQFGNPSGHCSFAAFFSMFLFHKYFIKIQEKDNGLEDT
jgi:membrane-associated phospholipid phosphatase